VVDSAAVGTHEHEITGPVELCLPNGKTLSPAAKGWSRTPLHDANLRGRWGRTKRWDYWGILAGDLTIAVTYADVDYLGIASVWWRNLPSGQSGGHDANVPFARGIGLPNRPGTAPLRYRSRKLEVGIVDDDTATTLSASWHERDGRPASMVAVVERPPGHDSLNVVIPWSDRQFQFTSKHQARPARGTLTVGDDVRHFGDGEDEAWGVLDVGRGRWPYRTTWNWGGGAGRSGKGAVIGLQFGAKWTEGTGFTENGVIVDGRLTKIGEELDWTYDWDQPLQPWRVRHPDGSLDLTLVPVSDKHTKVEALVMGTEVHQVFGRWSGHLTDDAGTTHDVIDLQGFAEESRSRW
jgi:hypothetical protein